MAIQTVTVPKPAVGHDWTYTVPGQWYPYLYGVTAQLGTSVAVPTTIPDESGNSRTGTVEKTTDYTVGNVGPFSGGADNVSVFGPNVQGSPNVEYCRSAVLAAFDTVNYSADGWLLIPTNYPAINVGIVSYDQTALSATKFSIATGSNQANPYDLRILWSGAGRFTVSGFASTGVWHHVGFSYDGTNARFYRDGTLQNTTAASPPAPGAGCAVSCGGNLDLGDLRGFAAGWAFYATALAGSSFANHAAASGSWSAYKTAVLLDSPTALYRIGQASTMPSRLATLKITNGTSIVGQYPANFASATAHAYTWSWQALGPGAQASTDGVVNAVPIPEIAIAAGYTIGTVTLDLASTDQWSNITLWFDDGLGTPNPAGQYPPYLDALLVPSDWSTTR